MLLLCGLPFGYAQSGVPVWGNYGFIPQHWSNPPYTAVTTGGQSYKYSMTGSIYESAGFDSSPCVDGSNYPYAGYGNMMYALNGPSLRWTFKAGGNIVDSCSLTDNSGTIYFGDLSGNFYSLSTSTGSQNWVTNLGGPIYAHTYQPIASLFLIVAAGSKLFALQDMTTSVTQAWSWDGDGSPITSYPALNNNNQIVYVQTALSLYSLSAATGVPSSGFASTANVMSFASPTMSLNGNLVMVGTSNGVIAINSGSGGVNWQWYNPNGAACTSTISVTLYAYVGCNDGAFYALNLGSGAQQYSYNPNNGAILSGSALGTNNQIIFATTKGNIYSLAATNLGFKWMWGLGNVNVTANVVISGAVLGNLVIAAQGVMYGIN